ncbi:MAG: hypothetical protein LBS84_12870 [Clostridiales bacterium]|jgi:hypothetical protein|nr:hypothetical protein [Clostridiales bacterium]
MNSNERGASFLELYQTEIAPQLQSLDIIIKSMDEPLTVTEAAEALYISEAELQNIMKRLQIDEIDQQSFLRIMTGASSPICRLYQRELDIGSPYVYTREEVSYIYSIPIDIVNQACEELGLFKLTAYTLPDLFSRVNMQPAGFSGL